MVKRIRFHGRGGEGVKLASRIVSRAAFLAGRTVQDSPLYGAERRGAPVVAFVRYSDGPIHERGYIEQPDLVVVMDDSLLALPEAAVLDGIDASRVVLVNTAQALDALRAAHPVPGPVVTVDISSIALAVLGRHLLSAPIAGATVKVAALAPWDVLAEAVRIEFADAGLGVDVVARNLDATRMAFEQVPAVAWPPCPALRLPTGSADFVVPPLPARVAAPSIGAVATSTRRSMGGWRVFRPVIDLDHCTRCFLCFALCPDGAIALDPENFPVVDYVHCKGCLVCASECPTHTIHEVREESHGA